MQRKKSKDKSTPLEKLIDWETRKGKWMFSQQFYELMVMKYWGITSLKDWQEKDEDERALLIAFYNTENMIRDYENYLDEIKQSK